MLISTSNMINTQHVVHDCKHIFVYTYIYICVYSQQNSQPPCRSFSWGLECKVGFWEMCLCVFISIGEQKQVPGAMFFMYQEMRGKNPSCLPPTLKGWHQHSASQMKDFIHTILPTRCGVPQCKQLQERQESVVYRSVDSLRFTVLPSRFFWNDSFTKIV